MEAISKRYQPEAEGASTLRGQPDRSERPAPHAGRTVLIVEDEQSIRDVLMELFTVEGVTVDTAATLAEAKCCLLDRHYDLVLTDIRLGGNPDGGFQVIGAAAMLLPKATVIALTAYPDDLSRQASLRLGAAHFLEKPVALERIAELASVAGVPSAMRPIALLVS